MKLFAGLGKTDYQDVLRAIGHYLDSNRLQDVRLWEHEDGIVLQGRFQDDASSSFQSIIFSDDDLNQLLEAAYARRGTATVAV
jgi:hypothetical protein